MNEETHTEGSKDRSKAKSFENLHVYQRARELAKSVYAATRSGPFARDYGLADQIRRAAVSVMANIAEGFERGGNAEFIQFLFVAKGSCGETRAHLAVALDQGYLDNRNYREMDEKSRQLNGMIANFIDYLKNSRYRGAKYKKPPK